MIRIETVGIFRILLKLLYADGGIHAVVGEAFTDEHAEQIG